MNSTPRPGVLAHLAALVGLAACDPVDGPADAALVSTDRYEATVVFHPDPPVVGPVRLDVDVAEDGMPVTGCAMTASTRMPEHGHGSMMEPTVTEVGDGAYEVLWDCGMAGHWEMTVSMDCPGGPDVMTVDFDVD